LRSAYLVASSKLHIKYASTILLGFPIVTEKKKRL